MALIDMQCRLCEKHAADGASLIRINEKGVTGLWECAPGTGCSRIVGEPEPRQADKVMDAITGKSLKWN